MTDEVWAELVVYIERYSIPPNPLFPNGLGVDVVVDETIPENEPRLGSFGRSSPIRMCSTDFDDMKRRVEKIPPYGKL